MKTAPVILVFLIFQSNLDIKKFTSHLKARLIGFEQFRAVPIAQKGKNGQERIEVLDLGASYDFKKNIKFTDDQTCLRGKIWNNMQIM